MIPLYSTSQIRQIDSFAINELKIPGVVLMENASREIFHFITENVEGLNEDTLFGIICGKGNNGGDGYAVARHLYNAGFKVRVISIGNREELSEDCRINYDILDNISSVGKGIEIKKFSSLKDLKFIAGADIIIDAMLGSGITGPLKAPYSDIVKKLNQSDAVKIAIDLPTGLNSDTGFAEQALECDLTVTLGEFKTGLFIADGARCCGRVVKGNIGISNEYFSRFNTSAYLIEPEDALNSMPVKKKDAHKYSAGKVLTIAGSRSLPGAAILTASSVLKAGAGASILAFPASVRKLVQKKLAVTVVEEYDDNREGILKPENLSHLKKRINWADVIAVGPGLGRNPATIEAVLSFFKSNKKKVVADADAIFALSEERYKQINLKNIVLTPHHGEFAQLTGITTAELRNDIIKYGKAFTEETGAYLVLKGAPSVIFNPGGEVFINTAGNPGMAKFGTGDVLTGVIAALLAQSDNIEEALIAAVYLHSLSADMLLETFTEFGYTAEDIMKNLPYATKFLRNTFAQ